jgi:hypothetical protein
MGDFLYLRVMNKFYIYLHIRKTDNIIFYVGKGIGDRAWDHYGRNKHWTNTVKTHGYEVKILAENLSEDRAFSLEKTLIEFYGRKDLKKGHLVNWTDGGEGTSGRVYSVETKRKIGDKTLERLSNGWVNPMTNKNHTKETKQKQRDCKIGKYDGSKNPNSRKIKDNITGEVYECVKDLSNSLGKNYSAFIRTIKDQMSKGNCRYSYV